MSKALRSVLIRLRRLLAALAVPGAAALALSSCGPSDPGERVWVRKCSGCHGRDGSGKAEYVAKFPYANLTDGRFKHGSGRAEVRRLVADGGDPRSPMPAYRDRLSPAELDAVVDLVLKIYAGTAFQPGKAPARGAAPR